MKNKYQLAGFLLAIIPGLSFAGVPLTLTNSSDKDISLYVYTTNSKCISLSGAQTGTKLSSKSAPLNATINLDASGECSDYDNWLIINFNDPNTGAVSAGYRYDFDQGVSDEGWDCYSHYPIYMTPNYSPKSGAYQGSVALTLTTDNNASSYEANPFHYCKDR